MQTMSTQAIRNAFTQFFQTKNHTVVPSASLIPCDDPTLLFVNAGMVPFKDVFLGNESKAYQRATSIQRCIRAGGKHNDLENVGFTARHHTFFEMLGNFSFGDYFKRDAIQMAWHFLTQELKLPQEKLWVTVYKDDQETANIWLNELKIDAKRFSYCGEKDNFWSMGDTGPCGPCTEIFYDHGDHIAGGPPGSPDEDGDRYIEIWNLVFMQYNRDKSGKMTSLPKPSVDTGMGLERIAAIMQGVHNNYDIDVFQTIIKDAAKMVNISDLTHTSLRVIADHIRACCFMILDGVVPSNEGRGYVLRRIIRRAAHHGHLLKMPELFFSQLVPSLAQAMGEAHPELLAHQSRIVETLAREETQFNLTLSNGSKIFEQAVHIAQESGNIISGKVAFKLYDTYGFPFDLTMSMARNLNLQVDQQGFDQEMYAAKARAKKSSHFKIDHNDGVHLHDETKFLGYDEIETTTIITHIFKQNETAEQLQVGEEGVIILKETTCYPEGGGQVGDTGSIRIEQTDGSHFLFQVHNTYKKNLAIFHQGRVARGIFKKNHKVTVENYQDVRRPTQRNHSATHLLHAVLRKKLGEHVFQKGSLVTPERLRFDFTHYHPLTKDQLTEIELMVDAEIWKKSLVSVEEMSAPEAKEQGAIALFGEKYAEVVRVIKIGEGDSPVSIELCGGTHVENTIDIQGFKIISESSVSAGVRRIEAITGRFSIDRYINEKDKEKSSIIENLKETLKLKDKELAQLKQKINSQQGASLANKSVTIGKIKLLIEQLENHSPNELRQVLDSLKAKMESAIIVLASVQNDKIALVIGVSNTLTQQIKAGDLMKFITAQIDGKGGGRPDMAQGGGTNIKALAKALASVQPWLKGAL